MNFLVAVDLRERALDEEMGKVESCEGTNRY